MQEERYVAIVDFGSSKVSLCVCQIKNLEVEEVLFKEDLPSDGISRGNILNPQKAAAPLKELMEHAREKTGLMITKAVVNLPRWNVKAENITHRVVRNDNNSYITQDEIRNLQELASGQLESSLDKNTETIYSILAQSYSTDDFMHVGEGEIIGSTSSFLEGHFLVFTGAKKYKDNIDRVFDQIGITAFSYEFTPVCDVECLLSGEERDRGAALVEIGSESTTVSVCHKGAMRYCQSFPFGGKVISEDIHTECNISENLAENIKLGFGYCSPERLQTLSDKTLKIDNSTTGECQQLPVKYLSEIVSCRMKEIISSVMYLIGESGFEDKLRAGIVLSGGGALIHCCSALVSDMTGLPCRIAYPEHFSSPKDNTTESMLEKAYRNSHINCALKEEVPLSPEIFDSLPKEEEALVPPKEEPKPKVEEKKQEKKHQKKSNWFGQFLNTSGQLFDNIYNTVGEGADNDETAERSNNQNKKK